MPEISPEKMFVMNTVNSMLMSRAALARKLDGPARDLNIDCGYPIEGAIDPSYFQQMYIREGIGTRVVELLPQESWQVEPEIYETEDEGEETEFELALDDFLETHNLFHYWQRADEQSGVGRFGVMLLGVDDGKELSQPLSGIDNKGKTTPREGGKEPVGYSYTRVLSEAFVDVGQWERDPKNPRYGQPITYNLKGSSLSTPGTNASAEPLSMPNVHWTRVIHLADNLRCSEVFGTPRMESVYNRLCDIRKLLGGSAEMFWKGAFPGVSFEMDPRITAADATLDPVAIRKEWEAYTNGLQRFVATEGLHANSLSVQVADPEMHLKVQIQAICIALGCPMRIFIGSEAAQLASSQDTKSWNGRLARRQRRYLTPRVIRPTIDRLIACGVLPTPADGKYCVKWPDLNTPSDNDKADVSLKLTQAMASYTSSGAEAIMPPLEWFTSILGMDRETAQFIVDAAMSAEELMTEPEVPELDPNQIPQADTQQNDAL